MKNLSPFRLWLRKLLTCWLPETRFFGFKVASLRWCGVEIGKNVRINSSAVFSGNGRLVIGDDVWVGAGDAISVTSPAEIVIGSHVDLGPQVMIITGSHKIDPQGTHIGGAGDSKSVRIGNGCWLGARATILSGVELAEKTLVAAGAVVTESIKTPCSLIAGVPAKEKKVLLSSR